MSNELRDIITAIDKFESDLGFAAPEVIPDHIERLRDRVRGIFEEAGAAAASGPQPAKVAGEPVQFALVEQLGHRSMVGITREITFCGKTMLEVQRIDVVPAVTVRVNPDTFYDVTDLTPDQAVALSRGYGRSTNGLDQAGVVTRPVSEHRQLTAARAADPWGTAESDEDDDESARELAEEGNAVAMSAAERDEYDRDGEAWLDAQDEDDADTPHDPERSDT